MNDALTNFLVAAFVGGAAIGLLGLAILGGVWINNYVEKRYGDGYAIWAVITYGVSIISGCMSLIAPT